MPPAESVRPLADELGLVVGQVAVDVAVDDGLAVVQERHWFPQQRQLPRADGLRVSVDAPQPVLRLRRPTHAAAAGAGRRKNARAAVVLLAAVSATSSPRSRASSSTICDRNIGSLRRSLGIGLSVRGSR
ncbi:ring-cleavage extradiol dioxygenase [Xanthomonas fragariae]|uniref:Ring-cleavage extradiol dioxygenase n=1 Tax=Xanthomonas fragariae TaxID=48664 RepID=A0A1Y6H2X9_9XANT|nr:hypothetical protein PD885_00596 [Xanthomonas fragariae]SMR04670.1 ring-cleavage extradiol dioxygenase [Xanthomonas fragariae]